LDGAEYTDVGVVGAGVLVTFDAVVCVADGLADREPEPTIVPVLLTGPGEADFDGL
jgi:hypothetical protein